MSTVATTTPSQPVQQAHHDADASWPHTPAEATAARLERFYLVRAQLMLGMVDAYPSSSRRWSEGLITAADSYGLAMLLHRIGWSYPVVADCLAQQLWLDLDNDAAVGSLVAEWLTERGLDPEAIRATGERVAREHRPRAEVAVLRKAVEAVQELCDSVEDAGRPVPDVVDAQWLLEVMASAAEAGNPVQVQPVAVAAPPDEDPWAAAAAQHGAEQSPEVSA
ncbi:MAG: hypothetical protein ABI140_07305 [Jatrophihabitantaceae bacterium]